MNDLQATFESLTQMNMYFDGLETCSIQSSLLNRVWCPHQDHIPGGVPAPDPPADQEAGGASAEGVLQRRPHHPAPARPGGEDRGLVQKPDEEVLHGTNIYRTTARAIFFTRLL